MITTREFFEHDAEDIINNIESIYSVQRKNQVTGIHHSALCLKMDIIII